MKTRKPSGARRSDAVTIGTALDLFAGAGGATQGLLDAGFAVLGGVESELIAAKSFGPITLRRVSVEADIRDVDPSSLCEDLNLSVGELTLLKACPPCQGYSSIGRGDPRDARNDLVGEVWRFARVLQPRAAMMENYPGLARDKRLPTLVRQLRAIGYSVKTFTVDATNVLCSAATSEAHCHRRPRWAGRFPGLLEPLLPAWFRDGGLQTAGEALVLASQVDAVRDVLHRARPSSPSVIARLRSLPVGGTRFDLPSEYQLGCHAKLTRRDATASYGRVDEHAPAPTMTTRCTTPACGQFVHPTEPGARSPSAKQRRFRRSRSRMRSKAAQVR